MKTTMESDTTVRIVTCEREWVAALHPTREEAYAKMGRGACGMKWFDNGSLVCVFHGDCGADCGNCCVNPDYVE